MKIIVKVRDIKIVLDEEANNTQIKYSAENKEIQNTLKTMVNEAIRLLNQIK